MNYELGIVGRRLQHIRERLGLSRRDIEERHNISANTIKAWELGKTEAGVLKMIKYLDIFKEYQVDISLEKIAKCDERSANYLNSLFDKSNISKEINGREQFDLDYLARSMPFLKQIKQDIASISNNLISALNLVFQEREELFQLIFNDLPIIIYCKDDSNRLLRLNRATASALGGNLNDFEGKNCYDLFPGSLAKKYHDNDLQVISSNNPRFDIIENYVTITGIYGQAKSARIPFINHKTGKNTILGLSILQDCNNKKKRLITH